MRHEQLKIGLPSDLRHKLEAEAAHFGISLGSVIRMTLEASFRERDRYDKETRALGGAVMELAAGLKRATEVPWGGHPGAAASLIEALKAYIIDRQQKLAPGEGASDDPGCSVSYPFEFDYDPETTGKLLARLYFQRIEEENELLAINDAMDAQEALKEGGSE
jgi:hypothetical protein